MEMGFLVKISVLYNVAFQLNYTQLVGSLDSYPLCISRHAIEAILANKI